MPGRIIPIVNDSYYHVYNRGSDKRSIFLRPRDYKRFQQTFYYYQFLGRKPKFSQYTKSDLITLPFNKNQKLLEIICYCLMPNHFHFLVRQLVADGLAMFMSQICNSYTKYFNIKYKRVGPLLQGSYKAVLVDSDEQLIHLSRYIHLNPIVSGISKDLNSYKWSSYPEFLTNSIGICSKSVVLDFFPSIQKYIDFVESQIEYGTTLETLKHQTIDADEE